MSPLLSILRAAHCRSTHHYFALDALRMVQTDAGLRLRGVLLKHHERYLTGAKDPDVRFRDFQNHVIHVQDGYFGGAPRLAIQWYDRLMGHLVAQRWEDAAYATGVLSHYFTDPLMPLHTAQCERETLVHRPMEWSVCKSYDRILKRWTEDNLRLVFQLGDGDGWLGEAILKGARFSNRSYKKLVESYNVDLGVENPVAGLDEDAIQIFAELFGLAITGLARIIERAAGEAENRAVDIPNVGLSMPALLAMLQVPEQLWLKRIIDKEERKAIEALVGEYRQTGTIRNHIPSELYIKQRVLEVRKREAAWVAKRRAAIVTQAVSESSDEQPISIPFSAVERPLPVAAVPASASLRQDCLKRSDELSLAPSIGPKTAAAFAEIKVFTIGEFIDLSAASMSRRLGKSWITSTVVEAWQSQTCLMCQVPGLLSRDVQMLVGVGCRTSAALAAAEAKALVTLMDRYSLTAEGRRALRGATVVEVSLVERWIAAAKQATATRQVA